MNSTKKEEKTDLDVKILNEKINTYEKILKAKLSNAQLSLEIKDMRETIDSIITSRRQNCKTDSFSKYSHNIGKDEEIQKIKKDKIEKEYKDLTKEIKGMKADFEKLKLEIEELNRNEIETEKKISSLNIYINNNIKIEEIKITPKENLKSQMFGEIDGEINSLLLLENYLDK